MPDATNTPRGPAHWNAAFAALPLERPDRDGWTDLAARIPAPPPARTPVRWPARIAIAAALALAVALPLRMLAPTTTVEDAATPATTVAAPTSAPAQESLETLYAESAQLESLLALARDDRVASGAAVEVGADLDRELARIDARLRQPGLDAPTQRALWRARVDTLRSAVSFESTRRWLAVHGERYDGALVQVD